ncbi:hypothetical protein [Pontibacter sp. H249]|uniref:hypothetical protein n=1 Tax=Pontibacter sp. H249 TaxID=3133420 RepID=UPI0030C056E2
MAPLELLISATGRCICFILVSSCLLLGCKSTADIDNPEPALVTSVPTVYTIPKGAHGTKSPFSPRSVTNLKFEATFDASAVYETTDKANQADINKLYGLADCKSDHHTNSARFGWRWYKNRLEIHAYTYTNKVRRSVLVDVVELNKSYIYELSFEDGKYAFKLNDKVVTMSRNCSGIAEGYQLYPYFGGDEAAPHDIRISILDLN